MSEIGEEHCSRWSGIKQDKLTDFHRRAIGVICQGLRCGPWNVPTNWDLMRTGNDVWPMLKVNVRTGGFATWDFDQLTRLVIGAHDDCIRMLISPSGPGMLCLSFWPREDREGKMAKRHPTIEEAIASYRRAV